MDDIPIDPVLLAESSAQAAARYRQTSSEVARDMEDDPLVEVDPETARRPRAATADEGEAGDVGDDDESESSGMESDSEDAYVDSEEEERRAALALRRAKGEVGGRVRGREKGGRGGKGLRGRGKEGKGKVTRGREVERKEDDKVFNRLAGVVGKAGEAGRIDVREMNIEDEIARAEKEDDGAGSKRPPPRKTARRTRVHHKPSYEVSQLLGRANMAFVHGDTAQTITLFTEVIRHDPYVISAWNTLSTVLEQEGDEEGARTMKFFAAHVDDEADTWKDLAKDFRQRGAIQQCVYCLKKALRADSSDLGVLLELATIYRLTKAPLKAIDVFKKIVKLNPGFSRDFYFLSTFHEVIIAGNNPRLAANSYKTAYDWHIAKSQPDAPESSMTLEHIITLIDDLTALEQFEEAVQVLRRGQRWLQGRKREKKWDGMDDDREYDPPDLIRDEPEDVDANADKDAGEQVEKVPGETGQFPLEVPLRHRLAVLRLRLGDDEEAMVHIDELLGLDVEQYHEMFLDLGRTLAKRELWEKALECLAAVQECDQIEDTPAIIYDVAICQQALGVLPEAIEALEWVVENDPDNSDAKYRLAEVLEQSGQKDRALELIKKLIQEGGLSGKTHHPRARAPAQPKKRGQNAERDAERSLTKAVLGDQMKQRMESLWDEVRLAEEEIGDGVDGALERFIQAAGTMVENFRLARTNFNKARGVIRIAIHKDGKGKKNDLSSQAWALQDRLERTLAVDEENENGDGEKASRYIIRRQKEFYGLGCEDWLSLVIKYCAVLMVKNEEDVAMDILEHVVHAGLFNNRRSQIALRMTTISCAMRLRSYERIVDNCRRLGQIHQFRYEPFLLMVGALSNGGAKAAAALQGHSIQKFVHRELVIHDDLVKGHKATYSRARARWNPVMKAGVSRRLGDEVPDPNVAGWEVGDVRQGDEAEDPGQGEDDDAEQYGYDYGQGIDDGQGDQDEDDGDSYETPRPTKQSPTLNILYGQYMLSTKAYQSALFYLFRGYEHVQEDPLLCLMIAQAFMGRAMTRQSDNRNFQISQAMAFLTKYRKYSRKDEVSQEEVEYNYGRAFHGIGVPHLAVKHYEAVLASIERRMQDAGPEYAEQVKDESLAYEVAHNLMQIYAAVGNMELVRLRSKWLAI